MFFLQVRVEERFHCRAGQGLVHAFDAHGDGLAALDAQLHQGHQLEHVHSGTVLIDGDGALILLAFLAQQAGRTGMNANGILDGLAKLVHGNLLQISISLLAQWINAITPG